MSLRAITWEAVVTGSPKAMPSKTLRSARKKIIEK